MFHFLWHLLSHAACINRCTCLCFFGRSIYAQSSSARGKAFSRHVHHSFGCWVVLFVCVLARSGLLVSLVALNHHLVVFCIHKCISFELCVQMPLRGQIFSRFLVLCFLLWSLIRGGKHCVFLVVSRSSRLPLSWAWGTLLI